MSVHLDPIQQNTYLNQIILDLENLEKRVSNLILSQSNEETISRLMKSILITKTAATDLLKKEGIDKSPGNTVIDAKFESSKIYKERIAKLEGLQDWVLV